MGVARRLVRRSAKVAAVAGAADAVVAAVVCCGLTRLGWAPFGECLSERFYVLLYKLGNSRQEADQEKFELIRFLKSGRRYANFYAIHLLHKTIVIGVLNI